MNDFRYAARTLRNSPGFTAIVTVLLALGIAANGVIFSAVDAVMLKRLPVREPEHLYRVVTNLPQLGKRSSMSLELAQALRDRAKFVSEIFGEQEDFSVLRDRGPSEQIRVYSVTPNFFAALGVTARYGRLIGPGDTDGAVLSYGFFERRFAANPDAIGRSIVLENQRYTGSRRYTIVGVLPKTFNGIAIDTGPDVRVPLDPAAKEVYLDLSVRLRDGASPAQASAEINAIRNAMDPKEDIEMFRRVELEPLEHGISRLRDRFSSALFFLTAAAGVLLLMVCVNVAGLLIARSAGRRQEMAVRLALGATRARLIRQMLAENLLLSSIGGLGGIALALAATPLIERMIPPQRDYSNQITPMTLDLHLDWRVFAFSLILCALTAIVLSLIPAWSAARTALDQALRSARASARWRGRQALMVFEIALCTALLAGAGLLVRTFEQLHHLEPGFDRDHVVAFTVNPAVNNYNAEQIATIARGWRERILQMPGVKAVAQAQLGLMRGSGMKTTAGTPGQRLTPGDFMNTSMNGVSLEYFDALGMRVVAGRNFVPADTGRTPRAVIVNQTFARRFLPGVDPIGKLVGGGAVGAVVKGNAEIVGVVSDAKYRSLREPIQPIEVFAPSRRIRERFHSVRAHGESPGIDYRSGARSAARDRSGAADRRDTHARRRSRRNAVERAIDGFARHHFRGDGGDPDRSWAVRVARIFGGAAKAGDRDSNGTGRGGGRYWSRCWSTGDSHGRNRRGDRRRCRDAGRADDSRVALWNRGDRCVNAVYDGRFRVPGRRPVGSSPDPASSPDRSSQRASPRLSIKCNQSISQNFRAYT